MMCRYCRKEILPGQTVIELFPHFLHEDCDKKFCGEIRKMMEDENGAYRIALYGDKATHAICRHGTVAGIKEDNHQCRWKRLVEL